MRLDYPDNGADWLHISEHDGSERPCVFAAVYTPSKEAERNGARQMWNYADGIKFCVWYTGILGGKPSHFKYKEYQ